VNRTDIRELMANGKPHDDPILDTVSYGLHPFPPDIEELIKQVYPRNPGALSALEGAPLHWARGEHLAEARDLLKGLLEHHGDIEACRALLRKYQASARR
jgi:hypothetical protein